MEIEDSHPMNIKSWSPEDRPREKLLSKGISSLSDAELIAILIGSGTAKLSAVDVAKKVLAYVENNLDSLAKLTVKELMKAKGIGEAKAITIVAALELGRRRKDQSPDEKPKIDGSKTAFDLIKGDLMDLPHEEFWVILLNRANRMIRKKRVSEGGVSGTVADPKIIFKLAVDELASGIIVVHNHPSGNLKPSESDINLTKKIKEAGKVLEIAMLDHLIIAHDRYFSFADEGLI
ncbi:MAG TPA: DNA repair protein RadC [Cyclobacteriaceae bacterium]|jgi:DNA repair protein RadC|nr:DNA repair protein RadC [Cyclobacteriaceae bacterium]